MQTIDIDSWPRRDIYKFYSGLDYPHFNICAEIDITRLHRQCRQSGISRFNGVLYGVSRIANEIEEFRQRIRAEEVVQHQVVHPSYTVLTDDNTFCFCETKYSDDITIFSDRTDRAILRAKQEPSLEDEPGRDDYLFISSLPWVRFTSVSHPIHMNPVDSIPRITWGRFSEVHKRVTMPLSIQVHHGLADGYHVGRFFELFQLWVENVDLSKTSPEESD